MMGRNRGRTDEDMKGGWMNPVCHPKYKSSQYRHYMFDRDQSIIDKQKSRYEKQQQKRIEMHEISKKVGIRVFP